MFLDLLKEYERRMTLAVDAVVKDFLGLRTGRASIGFLDPIKVDSYGSLLPLTQVGTINTPEANLITVQVWDRGLVRAVEKAIRESGLGVDPSIDGQMVRVRLPLLTQERRLELSKIASKYAEEGRISVRNIRREGMDHLKKLEKDKKISEDECKKFSETLQKKIDEMIKKIDQVLETKQKDIMQI